MVCKPTFSDSINNTFCKGLYMETKGKPVHPELVLKANVLLS